MEIDTHVSLEHFKEYGLAQEKELQKRKPRKRTVLEWIISVIVYGGLGIAYYHYQHSFNWTAFIIMFVLFIAIYTDILLKYVRIAQAIKFEDDGLLLGQHHYIIDDSGISASGKSYNMHVNWSLVIGILETKSALVIQLDGLAGFILVKNDVSDLETLRAFINQKLKGRSGGTT